MTLERVLRPVGGRGRRVGGRSGRRGERVDELVLALELQSERGVLRLLLVQSLLEQEVLSLRRVELLRHDKVDETTIQRPVNATVGLTC